MFKIEGTVVGGFRRGATLGFPTANLPQEKVDKLPATIKFGVYCGFAQIEDGSIFKMVLSYGWNPVYKNKHKSLEVHIMHTFEKDFYGKHLRVMAVCFLRPEHDFNSIDELISSIRNDISSAKRILSTTQLLKLTEDNFFALTTYSHKQEILSGSKENCPNANL